MSSELPLLPLSSIVRSDSPITYGVVKPGEEDPNGVAFIRSGDVNGGVIDPSLLRTITDSVSRQYKRTLLEGGEILVSLVGTPGQAAIVPCSLAGANIARQVALVRVDPTHSTRYIYYCLTSKQGKASLLAYSKGSVQQVINLGDLQTVEIPVPAASEQKAIAHILGILDDKIELNRKTNETLEAMAKALFKSWFVDFDPVRAKVEGRSTGLPAEISDLFADSFEDSELGEIPCGWETGRLEEILEIDPPRQLRRGSISPYLEMKGVPTSGHSAVDVIGREFSSGSKFRNGDTLLARITPCLENGKTAFVDFLKDGETGWGSTEFIVMCGRREEVNPFAYYLARSEVFRNNAIQNMVGSSGRQRVPSDAVSGFTLPLPPEEILVKFGLLATNLMRRISANADQSVILSKIRDALLPKLISGELRIPDAEKMLEEVGV